MKSTEVWDKAEMAQPKWDQMISIKMYKLKDINDALILERQRIKFMPSSFNRLREIEAEIEGNIKLWQGYLVKMS